MKVHYDYNSHYQSNLSETAPGGHARLNKKRYNKLLWIEYLLTYNKLFNTIICILTLLTFKVRTGSSYFATSVVNLPWPIVNHTSNS